MHRARLFLFNLLALLCSPALANPLSVSFGHRVQIKFNAKGSSSAGCLKYLEKNEAHFRRCKKEVCFIFLKEGPFVKVPKEMNETHQRLFPCADYNRTIKGLGGVAFRLHEELRKKDRTMFNNLCVWGGENCLFNPLVSYTARKAKDGYKFAITGLLLETANRLNEHFFSASIIDNKMIILGLARESNLGRQPFVLLTRPFRPETWAVIISTLIVFVLVALAIAFKFNEKVTLLTFFFILIGERGEDYVPDHHGQFPFQPPDASGTSTLNHLSSSDTESNAGTEAELQLAQGAGVSLPTFLADSNPNFEADDTALDVTRNDPEQQAIEQQQDSERRYLYEQTVKLIPSVSTRYWVAIQLFRIAVYSFLAIFLLFYEVAVVNFLFQQSSISLSQGIHSLKQKDLESYCVLKNSALEDVWRATVDPSRRYKEPYPWFRCDNSDICMNTLLNESNNVRYMVTFDGLSRYLLKKHNAINDVTTYNTRQNLYAFNGGWLYNMEVDENFRTAIDRHLLDLRMKDDLRKIVEKETQNPVTNSDSNSEINTYILLIPISFFVVFPMCVLLCLLCLKSNRMFFFCLGRSQVGGVHED